MPARTVLYEPNVEPKYAHFLTSGVASVIGYMSDGTSAEVGIWGKEGLVESYHLLGEAGIPSRCFMQVEGTALRMPFDELLELFQTSGVFRDLVLQCIQSQTFILQQISACNRLHEAEQRLARWLLMVRDRAGGSFEPSTYSLTQEFLAVMLGARRTTVTAAAGTLKKNNLIEYTRGRLHILDPEGLENSACECYQIVRNLYRNLYARPAGMSADRIGVKVHG